MSILQELQTQTKLSNDVSDKIIRGRQEAIGKRLIATAKDYMFDAAKAGLNACSVYEIQANKRPLIEDLYPQEKTLIDFLSEEGLSPTIQRGLTGWLIWVKW